MDAKYWGLHEAPFQSGWTSGHYFESASHEECLSRLLYLIDERSSCGVLFGPAGSGKSLVLEQLSRHIQRTQRELIRLDLTSFTGHELLWELCAECTLTPRRDATSTELWRGLIDVLSGQQAAGMPLVMIWDHFDRAEPDCHKVFERIIRLVQNSRWLTLILSVRADSAAELPADLRDATDLRIPLPWLSREETHSYIRHLLVSSGASSDIFDSAALDRLYELSLGSPRVLNQLGSLSLLAAMKEELHRVSETAVLGVASELQAPELAYSPV